MAKMTPQEYADKWLRRMQNSVQDYEAGVRSVTESPTAKAADKADKWLASIQQAHASGRYERRLREVTLQEWKEKTLSKGRDRLVSGAQASKGKVQEFAGELLTYIDANVGRIHDMADLTIEDSIARAAEWMRIMRRFKDQR